MSLNAIKNASDKLTFKNRVETVTGTIFSLTNLTEQEISGSGSGGGGKISGGGGYTNAGYGRIAPVKGKIDEIDIKIESRTHHTQKVFLLGSDKKEYSLELGVKDLSLREGAVVTLLWKGGDTRIIPRSSILFAYNHNTDEEMSTAVLSSIISPNPRPTYTRASLYAFLGVLILGGFIVFKVSPFGFIGNSLLFILTLILAVVLPNHFTEDITDHEHAAKCKATFEKYREKVSKLDISEVETIP